MVHHHLTLALAVFTALALPASPQDTPESTLDAARTALASDKRYARLTALDRLESLGGSEALKLVVQALADADPHVADRAQRVIVSFEEDDALASLLGKQGVRADDPLVQQRAAEAIGRLQGPVNAQQLLKHVKARNQPLARTLLWSIERLAQRDALTGKEKRTIKSVRSLSGRGDPDSLRASAIQTLSILAPRSGEVTMDTLGSDCGIETACAIMEVNHRLYPSKFEGVLESGLEHDEGAVRMSALDKIARMGVKKPNLETLIERIKAEPRVAIRTKVIEALQYFTGHRGGDDYKAWREYAEALSPNWTSADTKNAITAGGNVRGEFDKFEQIAPTSDRIAVLVDISWSYWEPTARRTAMPRVVSPAIGRLLRRIEQTGSFLLIPFAETPIPFSKRPIPASGANVQRAMDYLVKEMPKESIRDGDCNLGAALDYALKFKELDRIVVITASSEYTGEHADVELLARVYGERTRFRPAIFDFVFLNVEGAPVTHWGKFANARGGRHFELRVP